MSFDTPFVYALKNPGGAITFMGVYEKVELREGIWFNRTGTLEDA